MISSIVLLINLLLAFAALAVPSSQFGDYLARRREIRQSQPLNRIETPNSAASNIVYNSNWAGAFWNQSNETFTTVTGTFTIPTPSSNGSAVVWVGIDGDVCNNVLLQTGVGFTVSNEQVSYFAWYEWVPAYMQYFSGISLNAGDVIQATVTAYSMTSGLAVIENLTTGQTVQEYLNSSYALCEQSAEWIVEDYTENGQLVAFADFGTVTFSSATASGPSGIIYTPSGATIADIKQNKQVLTSVSIDGGNVTVSYI